MRQVQFTHNLLLLYPDTFLCVGYTVYDDGILDCICYMYMHVDQCVICNSAL